MTEVRPSEGSSGNLQAESDVLEKKIHHYGCRVPLTAAQLRYLQLHGQPVRFMVNPPGEDQTVMKNVYLDTATLTVLYEPPIGLTGTIPEHSNLSTVMILDHPTMEDAQPVGPGGPGQNSAEVPDYYTVSSYIIPTSSLVVAPQPNEGSYDVRFEATDNPTPIHYDYSSAQKRYALYEVRNGVDGSERIYLKPFKLSGVPLPRNQIIKGTLMDPSTAVPDDAFVFQAFDAQPTVAPTPVHMGASGGKRKM